MKARRQAEDKNRQEPDRLSQELHREIRGRKRVERALRASEKRYRLLLESISDIVYFLDRELKFTVSNDAAASFFRRPKEELLKSKLTDLFPRIRSTPFFKALRRVMRTGKPEVVARQYTPQGSQRRWYEVHFYPAPEGVLCITSDITRRKRAGQALQENMERFQALIENSSDIIQIVDAQGIIRYESPSVKRILGYTPEELIGTPSIAVVHPDDLGAVAKGFEEAFQKPGQPVITECRCKHKDGTWRVIEGTGINYIGVPGIDGFIATMHDTTDRRRVDEALRESEERYRNIVECASDTVTVVSLDGKYVSLNTAFETVTGWSRHDWVGKEFAALVHPDDLPEAARLFALAVERGPEELEVKGVEVHIRCKSGEYKLLEVTGRPYIENGELVGFVAIGRDITQRKQAEEKLQQAYEQEKEVRRRLEEEARKRVEFLRALVHELKTPMTAVMASSDLLTVELPKGPLLNMARNLKRGAENLDRRIDELLDLAKGELGLLHFNRHAVDMVNLLRQVFDDMAPVVSSHGHRMSIDLPPSIPAVYGNEARLRQVMYNLISNADKFMRQEGQITIRARTEDSTVIVEVQDTGRGISREQQRRVFNAYDRLVDDREHLSGLGLGLALSKNLIELHDGNIWVNSRKGKGSTFGFSIPIMTDGQMDGDGQTAQGSGTS